MRQIALGLFKGQGITGTYSQVPIKRVKDYVRGGIWGGALEFWVSEKKTEIDTDNHNPNVVCVTYIFLWTLFNFWILQSTQLFFYLFCEICKWFRSDQYKLWYNEYEAFSHSSPHSEKTSLKIFKHYKLKPSFSIINDDKANLQKYFISCTYTRL